jgi:hypothetical protein
MGLPIPNLDDKTFDELVEEARSLIARFAPEWTDHNVHDPGITFIELFAWLAEMQIYQLNRVTDENCEKFLKLVGLHPSLAQPAVVDITFGDVPSEKTIDAGTQIITEPGGEKIVFETDEEFTLIPMILTSVKTTYDSQTIDNTQANEKDDIYFAAFGEKAPQGATLELGFARPLPQKKIHIAFILFEEDLPSRGSHGEEKEQVSLSVNLVWEYLSGGNWNALIIKKDTTLALTRSGRIVFEGPSSMDKKDGLYRIRSRIEGGRYEIAPWISTILLNPVSAVQIETVTDENLKVESEAPEQKVQLRKFPVIPKSQKVQCEKGGELEDWHEVDDFELSGPSDPHYMFDPEKGEITFGNGLNGRIPLQSQTIRASYKITLGQKGNIPKGQKWWINKKGIEEIIGENLTEATGGKSAESIEQAKKRAKKDFRTRYRAITSNDYEQLALSTPGLRVARAKAIPGYNPDYPCIAVYPGAVTIVAVPYAREGTVSPVPGNGFLQTVFSHLDMHRLVTTDLYVIAPEYVKVSVKCKVRLMKRSSPTEVVKRVKKALGDFLDPLNGGPNGEGWPFGRSVYPSEIYQIIDGVEGVDYATGVSLSAEGQYQKVGDIIKIPPIALVFSGEHQLEVM